MIVDAPEDVSRKLPSSLEATEFPSMARLPLAKEFREGFLELVRELGMSAYIDDILGTEMTLPVQTLLVQAPLRDIWYHLNTTSSVIQRLWNRG
jgi:hypothetical protein